MAISIIEIDGNEYQLGASASNVTFNNTGTGIQAGTVQRAIQEVKLTAGSGITINDGVISATGGGGGSQDVSGKADLLAGTDMLTPSQWPKVALRNVTDTMLDDLNPGDIYFDSGYLFLHTNGDPVSLGHPNQKTIYYCLADDKLYRWNGNIFQPVLSAVSTLQGTVTQLDNRLVVLENASTSGMTPEQYAVVTGNVNTLQAKIDELIGKLANSSFSVSPKPALVGELDWDGEGGGETTTYNITQTLTNCTSSNTSSTITDGSTFTTTLSASNGYTLDGVTPIITMNGNPVSGAWNATSKVITITNVSGNIAIGCTAVLVQQSYNIGYTLSHCTKSQDSATSVVEGGSFSAVLIPDTGYTMNGVQATGTGFSQSYDSTNDRINISGSNVSGNVSIGCTAATFQVSVSYNLTGFQSETNTQITSGGSFTKMLSPNTGYSVKTIAVTMGGTDITATAWTAATRTINIPLVTGNIVITATAEEAVTRTISFDLTGCTASGQTEVVDGDSTTITLTKGNDWSSTSSSGGSEYNVPFNKRDILVMRASDYVPLIEGTDYTISQTALDANIVISFSAVSSDILVMNIVWATKGIKISSGSETFLDQQRYAHIETYIPVATNCRALSIMTNIVTTSPGSGAALYDQSKQFTGGENAEGLNVIELNWDASQQSSNAFVRSTVYSWYKQQKEEEGYYGTIPPGEPITGNTFEKVAAWCYIYDKTNGRFIWKGENAATSYVFTHQTLGQE